MLWILTFWDVPWRQHRRSFSPLTHSQSNWSSCRARVFMCVWESERSECARGHGHIWRSLAKADSLLLVRLDGTQHQKTSSTAALMWFLEPCPRAWRRGRTTGPTKSMRASSAGPSRASWGWSSRAAQKTDSSPSSGSRSRAQDCATAVNCSRRNCSWKWTTPRWLDSPPGTSRLWSNTARTPSDSSVSNKVRLFFFFWSTFPHFCAQNR